MSGWGSISCKLCLSIVPFAKLLIKIFGLIEPQLFMSSFADAFHSRLLYTKCRRKQLHIYVSRIIKLTCTYGNIGKILAWMILPSQRLWISMIHVWFKPSGNRKSIFQTQKRESSNTLQFQMCCLGLNQMDRYCTCSGNLIEHLPPLRNQVNIEIQCKELLMP